MTDSVSELEALFAAGGAAIIMAPLIRGSAALHFTVMFEEEGYAWHMDPMKEAKVVADGGTSTVGAAANAGDLLVAAFSNLELESVVTAGQLQRLGTQVYTKESLAAWGMSKQDVTAAEKAAAEAVREADLAQEEAAAAMLEAAAAREAAAPREETEAAAEQAAAAAAAPEAAVLRQHKLGAAVTAAVKDLRYLAAEVPCSLTLTTLREAVQATQKTASAQHGGDDHHDDRYNSGSYGGSMGGLIGGIIGGLVGGGNQYGNGGYPPYNGQQLGGWGDTGHYDYHPGSYVPHGNHYHYMPGHYDYHNGPHWGSNMGGNSGRRRLEQLERLEQLAGR
ncbi:hypothetical protein COO60DRAFT_1706734 [Scenedesmus sp. NREL 46B-D3]|nr:hypothetical protein COO60DRAFT_1706734 [Scenedesmus sp. NREL 46B-D3]